MPRRNWDQASTTLPFIGALIAGLLATALFAPVAGAESVIPGFVITTKPLKNPLSYKKGGGSFKFSVPSEVTVDAVNGSFGTLPSWLHLSKVTLKRGKGAVTFLTDKNESSSPRNGTIPVGGATFEIAQAGAPCSITAALQPSTTLPDYGGAVALAVTVQPADCRWQAVSGKWSPATTVGWVTGLDVPSEVMTGNASLPLVVAANSVKNPAIATSP